MALPPFPTMGNWFAGNDTPYNKSDTLLSVGLGLLSGKNAQDQVGQAASNFANNRQMGRTYNKTIQYLQAANPELAQAVESGALSPVDAYKLYITSKAKADRPRTFQTLPDGTYGFADPDTGTFNPLGKAPKPTGSGPDGTGAYYGTTIPYYDAAGTLRYKQLGKDGNGKDVDFGGGVAAPPTKIFDSGTEGVILAPGGRQIGAIQKDVVGAASDTKLGNAQGDARAAYNSMASKMPGLEAVVKDLDVLADKATYTGAGQVLDLGRKQLGMAPRDAAVARAQYISTVDNQVLPLLRDTFGAAFTQREGETLRDTLGDPDKSPQEKKVVLRSFIEQKRRDLQALAAQSGQAPGAPPGMAAPGATSSGVKWSVEP
ncbi:hypothetical protein R1538_34635 [Rhizobium leguminosarum]|uniref:hypothetical protein n=1 Tax=Rhizobium leguminosarum TaxID=384 RepID=UPI00293DA3D3|nr:hypothetical protein [Rhizobium leguminosarum]MDV4166189.1 hypothetical protein [Rhizobium leguminosarum]